MFRFCFIDKREKQNKKLRSSVGEAAFARHPSAQSAVVLVKQTQTERGRSVGVSGWYSCVPLAGDAAMVTEIVLPVVTRVHRSHWHPAAVIHPGPRMPFDWAPASSHCLCSSCSPLLMRSRAPTLQPCILGIYPGDLCWCSLSSGALTPIDS